jgi:DNA replication and repair protein RecF
VFLQKIRLYNFRNIAETQLEFSTKIVCLLGKNGSGKTSLLDAIHYLSFTKSAVNPSDGQNVRDGQPQFLIKGQFELTKSSNKELSSQIQSPSPSLPRTLAGEMEGMKQITCTYTQGQKKIITEDGQDYTKFSEHVGKYPVVLIAPQDIELIWDGSEMRRKFFDSVISQLDKPYLENLIVYTNQLKQRNSLLRAFAESGKTDNDLLASYDQKLVPAANYIFSKRREFLIEFFPFFQQHYNYLVGQSSEDVSIRYQSDLLGANFSSLLSQNLQRDIVLQRTSTGIHRDDFDFQINGFELKRHGSQGQQKSFLIALKLAEFQAIAEKKKFKPILLLDDIFDKLDDERIQQLMHLVAQGTFGQLFITDARADRTQQIIQSANLNATIFRVENGNFTNG